MGSLTHTRRKLSAPRHQGEARQAQKNNPSLTAVADLHDFSGCTPFGVLNVLLVRRCASEVRASRKVVRPGNLATDSGDFCGLGVIRGACCLKELNVQPTFAWMEHAFIAATTGLSWSYDSQHQVES